MSLSETNITVTPPAINEATGWRFSMQMRLMRCFLKRLQRRGEVSSASQLCGCLCLLPRQTVFHVRLSHFGVFFFLKGFKERLDFAQGGAMCSASSIFGRVAVFRCGGSDYLPGVWNLHSVWCVFHYVSSALPVNVCIIKMHYIGNNLISCACSAF